MKVTGRWARILGIGMSIPSTIFVMAWGTHEAIEAGLVSKPIGWLLFMLVIAQSFYLLIYTVMKKKP